MELNFGELLGVKIQPKNPDKFYKARVKWIFTSGFEIRGGRITASKVSEDGLWVQFPKYQARNGKWVNIIKLDSEAERYIEEETLKEYYRLTKANEKLNLEELF